MNTQQNLPPFYVGEKIVAIKHHSKFLFRKDQVFSVKSIRKGFCPCAPWIVDIGIIDDFMLPQPYERREIVVQCGICKKTVLSTATYWIDTRCFLSYRQTKFPLLKLEKIREGVKHEQLSEN